MQDEITSTNPLSSLSGRLVSREGVGQKLIGQIPLLVLLALGAVASLFTGEFLSTTNINNVLVQTSVLAVVSMGQTFVIIGGGFDLSVGSVVALSGSAAALVMPGFGILPAVAMGILVGALVGSVNGLAVTVLRVNPFITTLATMTLVRGVVFLLTDGAPVPVDSLLPRPFLALSVTRFLGINLLVWIPFLLLLVLSWVLGRTRYGRSIYAVGGNSEAAYLSGIRVNRVKAFTYVLSGALAGIAGVMLASRLQSGQPTAGEFYELQAVAAVVLGGVALHGGEGKLYKSIIGVLIMVVLGNALNLMNVGSYWQRVAIGAVILAAAAAGELRAKR